LTAEKLLAHSRLPLAWHDQRIAQISQIIEEYFMGLTLARYLEIAVDVHGPDRRINDPAVPVPGILGMIFHLTKARCT